MTTLVSIDMTPDSNTQAFEKLPSGSAYFTLLANISNPNVNNFLPPVKSFTSIEFLTNACNSYLKSLNYDVTDKKLAIQVKNIVNDLKNDYNVPKATKGKNTLKSAFVEQFKNQVLSNLNEEQVSKIMNSRNITSVIKFVFENEQMVSKILGAKQAITASANNNPNISEEIKDFNSYITLFTNAFKTTEAKGDSKPREAKYYFDPSLVSKMEFKNGSFYIGEKEAVKPNVGALNEKSFYSFGYLNPNDKTTKASGKEINGKLISLMTKAGIQPMTMEQLKAFVEKQKAKK